MGRYYDVSAIIAQGRRIGPAGTRKPYLGKDETLVGIVIQSDGNNIQAIAPDLTREEQYKALCIDGARYGILRVELYSLTPEQASKIPDALAVNIANLEEFLRRGTEKPRRPGRHQPFRD